MLSVLRQNCRYKVNSHTNGVVRAHVPFNNTVERVKEFHNLSLYVCRLTSWVKKVKTGYWYTHCPMCQVGKNKPKSVHSFIINTNVCGCSKPGCDLNGWFDVISLHATLNRLTNSQAIADLAQDLR